MICLEYKHVSLRLTQRIPTIDDVITDVVAILDKFDIGRCAASVAWEGGASCLLVAWRVWSHVCVRERERECVCVGG